MQNPSPLVALVLAASEERCACAHAVARLEIPQEAFSDRYSHSNTATFEYQRLREKGVGIDLVNQPIETVGEDDWMAEMMLNMMMVFADAECKMIRLQVQEDIDAAIEDGKRVGRSPFGYT